MADLFSTLPLDVIFDIFIRLPLKSISECRWVSKLWYSIIRLPLFAKLHFDKNGDDLPLVIFASSTSSYLITDPEFLPKSRVTVYDVNFKEFKVEKTRVLGSGFRVVGTVNGLVCLDHKPYYVVNPITGDYILLPKSLSIHVEPLGAGFGFDSVGNEYKVVRILPNRYAKRSTNEYGHKIEIYTLGSGCWREIQLPNLNIVEIGQCNVLLHGRLHWIARVKTEVGDCLVIVTFDLDKEEFGVIKMPPLGREGENIKSFGLVVLNECLRVVDTQLKDDKKEWVMKIYGVHTSWVKEYFLEPKSCYDRLSGVHQVMELKNGELLLADNMGNLSYYECKREISKPIMLYDLDGKRVHVQPDFAIYLKGSLFSPKAIDCDQRGKINLTSFQVHGTTNCFVSLKKKTLFGVDGKGRGILHDSTRAGLVRRPHEIEDALKFYSINAEVCATKCGNYQLCEEVLDYLCDELYFHDLDFEQIRNLAMSYMRDHPVDPNRVGRFFFMGGVTREGYKIYDIRDSSNGPLSTPVNKLFHAIGSGAIAAITSLEKEDIHPNMTEIKATGLY